MRKNIKKVICGLLTMIFCLTCLAACGGNQEEKQEGKSVKIPTYDENGNYTGFSDIGEDSELETAAAHGCYVVDGNKLYSGMEAWENFVAQAEAGNDAYLRVVHIIYPWQIEMDSTGDVPTFYYDDLNYYEGKYYFFCYNGADDIRDSGPFTYLRALVGVSGNPAKERTTYVLTDSLDLTYDDVEWSFLSSNLEYITMLRVQWLGFAIYMREEFQ